MKKRTNLVFTLLQVIAVLIALAGTGAAFCLAIVGVESFCSSLTGQQYGYVAYAIIGLATVAVVSIFSYGALYHFFTLCQRLKNCTAFTPANERGMHRIAVCCVVCGGTLVVAMVASLPLGGFYLPFLELLFLLAAAYLCIGLVAYALELLLQRATVIQQENDLTI